MASPSKRIHMDFMELLMKDFKVELQDDNYQEFLVEFHGPKDSFYEGFKWKVKVVLTDEYPIISPTLLFITKIYHPNIDIVNGIICVNVLTENWSPLTTLVKVFEEYLPMLLQNPNADSPLNSVAAAKFQESIVEYGKAVREHCLLNAIRKDDGTTTETEEQPTSSSSEKSEEDVS